jgi:DNA-binding response OmpR family regulator
VNGAAQRLAAVPSVLIVDDEPQIVELLRTYLEREGFNVAQAADGEVAISATYCNFRGRSGF